jgi:hypothetical protein
LIAREDDSPEDDRDVLDDCRKWVRPVRSSETEDDVSGRSKARLVPPEEATKEHKGAGKARGNVNIHWACNDCPTEPTEHEKVRSSTLTRELEAVEPVNTSRNTRKEVSRKTGVVTEVPGRRAEPEAAKTQGERRSRFGKTAL